MLIFLRRLFCRGRSARLEQKLDLILQLQGKTMGQLEDLTAAFDAETTAVAARIDKLGADLQAAISNGQAPKPETLAALAAISDRLKALGTDPANPIPPDQTPPDQTPAAAKRPTR